MSAVNGKTVICSVCEAKYEDYYVNWSLPYHTEKLCKSCRFPLENCGSSIRTLCKIMQCLRCFDKSLASHPKSEYYDREDEEYNQDKTPRDIFRGSHQIYMFKCDKETCPHEFKIRTLNVTRKQPQWCSYCAGKRLCDDSRCIICEECSFQSHPKAKYWHPKKNDCVTPRDVFLCSRHKYCFKCDVCCHDFDMILGSITYHEQWCPYCAGKKRCKNPHCVFCKKRSFQSHPTAKYWHPTENGNITPRDVASGSNRKYSFRCENGHDFKTAISYITSKSKPSWCPLCKNKTETKVLTWLQENKYNVSRQHKFDWCMNPETGRKLPFDFFLPDYNIIIEVDGIQHFEQVSNWQSPEETKARDQYKENLALEHGITVLRFLQKCIYWDKFDWREKLKEYIRIYPEPVTKYFGSNGQMHLYGKRQEVEQETEQETEPETEPETSTSASATE